MRSRRQSRRRGGWGRDSGGNRRNRRRGGSLAVSESGGVDWLSAEAKERERERAGNHFEPGLINEGNFFCLGNRTEFNGERGEGVKMRNLYWRTWDVETLYWRTRDAEARRWIGKLEDWSRKTLYSSYFNHNVFQNLYINEQKEIFISTPYFLSLYLHIAVLFYRELKTMEIFYLSLSISLLHISKTLNRNYTHFPI